MSKEKVESAPKSTPVQKTPAVKSAPKVDVPVVKAKNSLEDNPDFRNIVRIVDTDLKGDLNIERALLGIKGLDLRISKAISKVFSKKAGIKYGVKIGLIPKNTDDMLSSMVKDPVSFGIPSYMINRSLDRSTGKNMHLVNSDLDFAQREDKQLLSRIKARRGLRLSLGLRVRGQRSHSNFRRGKGTMGVIKSKDGK